MYTHITSRPDRAEWDGPKEDYPPLTPQEAYEFCQRPSNRVPVGEEEAEVCGELWVGEWYASGWYYYVAIIRSIPRSTTMFARRAGSAPNMIGCM